jgi:hypothetical protein
VSHVLCPPSIDGGDVISVVPMGTTLDVARGLDMPTTFTSRVVAHTRTQSANPLHALIASETRCAGAARRPARYPRSFPEAASQSFSGYMASGAGFSSGGTHLGARFNETHRNALAGVQRRVLGTLFLARAVSSLYAG